MLGSHQRLHPNGKWEVPAISLGNSFGFSFVTSCFPNLFLSVSFVEDMQVHVDLRFKGHNENLIYKCPKLLCF